MKKITAFLLRNGFVLLGFLTLVSALLLTFWPVLPKYAGLISPDAMPFFEYPWATLQLQGLLTGSGFTPHVLYWLLNPLYTHELAYMVDTLVLTLGAVYYLRRRRAHPLAAWFGGVALGLSGYTFTLFSAGHRGYFHMFACAIWMFGLLIRCFETRRWFYFAMLGLVIAWGVPCQPDVLLLVCLVAVAYALWLTLTEGGRRPEAAGQAAAGGVLRNVFSVWPRFAISLLVLALVGYGGLRSAVTTQMTSRDQQIAAATGQAAEPARARTAEQARERWFFATNWSLPPEDALEFVAAGVYGNEAGVGRYPYWGRLGRPHDGVFQKGRMMPNYRQHTVYLGVVSLLLGLLAAIVWLSGRRRAKTGAAPLQPASGPGSASSLSSDVPFWCAVWAVCLLLAFGRYTPLYRLFYAIPYMDYIRAPVKFLHLVELSTAFLAGFGVDALLRGGERCQAFGRRLIWLSGSVLCLLVVLALVALVARARISQHIVGLDPSNYFNLAANAQSLAGYAVQNLLRAAGLVLLVVGAGAALALFGQRAAVWVVGALLVVLAADQALVARRYVRALDVTGIYRENAVVKAVSSRAGGQVVNLINYVTPNACGQEWLSSSLWAQGIRNLLPSSEQEQTPNGRLFAALQNDPARLWRILNIQHVILSKKNADAFVRAGVVKPVLEFSLGRGAADEQPVLVSVVGATPGPRAVTRWRGGVPAERQYAEVARADLPLTTAPEAPVQTVGGGAPVKMLHEAVWGLPWQFETRMTVDSAGAFLLIFNQKHEASVPWEVRVDGALVEACLTDGYWLSAVIPAGGHQVVVRKRRDPWPGLLSAAASFLLVAVGVGSAVRARRVGDAGALAS